MNAPINNLEKLKINKLPENFEARVIHENPYIVKIKNFLTDEEVNELLKLAEGKFERSNIVIDGKLVITNSRTSSTAYLFDK